MSPVIPGPKVRKTLTLDPEIVAEFADDEAGLSAAVNAALRETVERRARQRRLRAFVDELNANATDGDIDPAAVQRAKSLLGARA